MSIRSSIATMAVNGLGHVLAALVGVAIAGTGVTVLMKEMSIPPFHAVHVYVAAGLIFFGALLIIPTQVTSGLKQTILIIGPYLPVIGGRRAGDPPSEGKG